jgi:uncharacterized protein involved in outer membrane biogenesis
MVRKHKTATWVGIIAAALLLVIVLFLSLFDWNALRPFVARRITAATGRPASIDGDLKVHLWSLNPTAEVNDLKLENPPNCRRFAASSSTAESCMLSIRFAN